MNGNEYQVRNHQLRLLEELAEELRLDPIWLLENAKDGNLPAMMLPRIDCKPVWYCHFYGTCDAIAGMILTEFLNRKAYPTIESDEKKKGAASE